MKIAPLFLLPLLLAPLAGALSRTQEPDMPNPSKLELKKATPVMIVERIEPVLPFWVERLGFARTVEVPEDDHLAFVILVKDGIELMFQTWTSVQADAGPGVWSAQPKDHTPLFIEVADLAAVRRALTGCEVLVSERKTFYGSTETLVRAPGGTLVTFAQFPASDH